jgi:hypothetical protein
MEYTEADFVEYDYTSDLSSINKYMEKNTELKNNYENKFKNIGSKIVSLSQKQYFDINTSLDLLIYQQNIIKNEKNYLHNLSKIFNAEFKKQMFNLSEKTTIMYISLQDINKDINKESNNDKQIKKSVLGDNYIKIIENIKFNFINIKILLLRLKNYNEEVNLEMKDKNFHCKTLGSFIHKKRILIFINYKKIYETFVTIIKYFASHATILLHNLNNDKNYLFLVESNINNNNNIKDINVELTDNESTDDELNNSSENEN